MTIALSNYRSAPVYIHSCGFHSALGSSHAQIHARLQAGKSPDMLAVSGWLNNGSETVVGKAMGDKPVIPEHINQHDTSNNQLALSALQQIEPSVRQAIAKYGAERVAVVVGTSTSGIATGEEALSDYLKEGQFPPSYHYQQQEVGNLGEFVADYLRVHGPVYTVSTACSSSGRVFLSARRLLNAGIVDAVVVGGADSLCKLTLNGFNGLEALSNTLCLPFSEKRQGINIGEGASFMLLSLSASDSVCDDAVPPIAFLGGGESSDAHHISAPHPEGEGAEAAMRNALKDAGISPQDIGYINAHGTATPLNDAMEAKAIFRVFQDKVPVSSTKPLTGHTLGAAGAVEAAICWHILRYRLDLPLPVNHGITDQQLAPITTVTAGMSLEPAAILSNSFAFGGNNISLIFGYAHD
ncbi:beta-ketoacyl-[acyl-carrier-protein] synthase family protein [Photobacterium lutimaris]|uniref:Beta-ketoacyl-[acyl-carrier-protein] synthase II n=1 Tax=Photobacterium lutimaris TaxID=388278 RepID=A0A2T3J3C4_9GAMM|nr:beta-ketoacyl-[acyl-carrier-protein] synthase family protein [Photobacterium lutimaris]PSU35790.1 beta-ketoacyl-[acyl-carrier-protein] synthase II [Photobacterium lutimaris]TDR78861.1 3-oxoacyl-[acyl-carrier-protein] synthase-1 [Photobacterium lutimaris]